jgi:diguanylate cyclase
MHEGRCGARDISQARPARDLPDHAARSARVGDCGDADAGRSRLHAVCCEARRRCPRGVVGVKALHRILVGSPRERLIFAGVLVGLVVSMLSAALAAQVTSDGVIAVCAMTAGGVWLWRLRETQDARRRPWILFALGYACWGIAETIWFGYDIFAGGSPPQPSVADPVYMLGYGLIAAGVIRLVMARGVAGARSSALDALALTIALGTILVQLELVAPGALNGGWSTANVLAVVYAALDVPLLGGIAWLLLSRGRRGATLALIVGAFAAMYAGDVAYALGVGYWSADVAVSNFAYPMAYLLAAAAALHPATTTLDEPTPANAPEDHATRLVFLAIALALPAFLDLFAPVLGLPPLGNAAAVVTILVSVVIVMRMARLLQENNRVQSRARAAHQSLQQQATRDHLTGLYNRGWATEHLQGLLEGAFGDGQFAVLYIDLDGFKLINDDLGHDAGDDLLRLVAERLVRSVRSGDWVVRLGGDEFVVICPPQVSNSDAERLASRVVALLSERFQLGSYEVNVTASIGVLTAGAHTDAVPADLLRDADVALYRAKEVRSTWRVFNAGMRAKSENRLEILAHLRSVIRSGRLRVVYQPIVNLTTGRVEGLEALARLTMPDGLEIPPPVFVGIAESTGAALTLDTAVMARALEDLRWLDQRCPAPLRLAVNLSASEVTHPGLVGIIGRLLNDAAVEPSRLTLEVTETAVVKDLEAARAQLQELREIGVGIDIDDFGTGYSSMAYLHSLPVSGIKIDRSFVQGVFMDANQALITEGMIRMGNALGLRVIGEGIEEAAQSERMRELGCDAAQGYFFGRPMARESVLACLSPDGGLVSARHSGFASVEAPDDPVDVIVPSIGVPVVVAQITKHGDHASRLDHELEEVSLDRLVGPPAVLHDPLVADVDNPAATPPDLDGMGHAGGGADYSRGPWDSEMS